MAGVCRGSVTRANANVGSGGCHLHKGPSTVVDWPRPKKGVSHHSDCPPVQKGYGANLEYVGEIGGQLRDSRGKMEVPA